MGDNPDGAPVNDSVAMADGDSFSFLVSRTRRYLSPGQSLLELDMGGESDLDLLSRWYQVAGSDLSIQSLDAYRSGHPLTDLLQMDVRLIPRGTRFDALYSNKVLSFLSPEELAPAFDRMTLRLNDQGILVHSFWRGDGEEEINGNIVYFHDENLVREMLEPHFRILESQVYQEDHPGDSFYIIARIKS